ncbi:MAG: PepSY domain-containing protein [Steroidobacteraceae bacterium]
MSRIRAALLLSVALSILCGGPTALQAREADVAPAAPLTHSAITMNQAVRMVERRFRARVVRAETRKDGGATVYVLRLLDQSGRVFTVRVDAASGRIL